MTKRRIKGSGSVHTLHDKTCPAPYPDDHPVVELRGERPKHTCRRPRYRWQIDLGWVAGKRDRRSGTATSQREAQRAIEAAKQQAERGVLPDNLTVADWITHWLDNIAELKPSTRRSYTVYLNTWLIPHLGKIQLQKLRPDHVRAMQASMRDAGRAESTVLQANAILKSALQVAVNEQRIDRNVAKLTTPKAPDRKPHAILTLAQAQQVIAAAPTLQQRVRLVLALMVGLRQGEALGLRWEDVHLDAPTPYIAVEWESVRVKGAFLRERPKSRTSRRQAPLVPAVAELLRLWQAESGGVGYVFPGDGGDPVHPRKDWKQWSELLELAGVPHVPLHGARGTAATFLVEQGVPITAVAGFLGHADPKVTMQSYAHVTERLRMQPMNALEAMLQPEQR